MLLFLQLLIIQSLSIIVNASNNGCLHPSKRGHVKAIISDAPSNGLFPVGSTITYNCDTGYDILNNQTRQCLSNSQWSQNEPYCGIDVSKFLATAEYKSNTSAISSPWTPQCISLGQSQKIISSHSEAIWTFIWYTNYHIDLVAITFQNFSDSENRIPKAHYSTAITNGIIWTKLEWTTSYTLSSKQFVVHQFVNNNPKKSKLVLIKVSWPSHWKICQIALYTNSDLPDSFCSFPDRYNVKHFSYDNKCFAVFANNIEQSWSDVTANCENYKKPLNSSVASVRQNDFISYLYAITIHTSFHQRYFWIIKPTVSSACFYIDMKSKNIDSSCHGDSGQMCEYSFPKCGTPEQTIGSLMKFNQTTASYICPENYELNGTSLRTCLNGQWTSEPPSCVLNDTFHCGTGDSDCLGLAKKITTKMLTGLGIILIVQWTLTGAIFVCIKLERIH